MLVRRRLLRFVRQSAPSVLLTVVLALAAAACAFGQAFAVAAALHAAITGSGDAVRALAVFALLVLVRSGLLWGRDLAARSTAENVKRRVRSRLTAKLAELGPAHTVTHPAGSTQTTLGDGVTALQGYVGFYVPQLVVSLLVPAAGVALLMWIDPAVGFAVGLCLLAAPLSRRLWGRILGERGRRHWMAYENFAARIMDALQGMTTLTSLGAGPHYGQRLRRDAEDLYRATMGNLAASSSVYIATGFFFTAGTSVAVALAAVRTAQGHLDALALLLVLWCSIECFRPLHELQNYWHEGFTGLSSGQRIVELLDTEPVVSTPRTPAQPPNARQVATGVELSLTDVTFTYPEAIRPAVHRVWLHVPAGSTQAIVGRSGAGKSTLVHLLTRVFDPDQGQVCIAGIDLRSLDPADARGLTTVVSQDTYLFHGTVAENLRIAHPSASDEELYSAARRARIHEFVRSLPQGYDTVLTERAADLSGGQRQRIAIARALLKDAPVLILDEATASVDGATEALLNEALAELRQGRTTVVIAHRLSTVVSADQIAVLDEGQVVENGTPAELADRDGYWSRLRAAHRESHHAPAGSH
ncbi:ABC transporter ATP-binding protein [Lipingzhangella sp. LS1_29]|uniref:ABC transporter ATP-binding protein n=1 Tax=Lipingzhangella rawalii TaxID=2055835 RepID=A0ABU2H733_9ACTN|nr:ABC transporter ATP-binding protein [Lipingzhangella rawalii]MDS1270654.1 ABC transporter ATP-binding protein [Lipingzhangella rawalii]